MRQDVFRPLPDDAAAPCDPSDDPSTTRTSPMSAAASSMLRRLAVGASVRISSPMSRRHRLLVTASGQLRDEVDLLGNLFAGHLRLDWQCLTFGKPAGNCRATVVQL